MTDKHKCLATCEVFDRDVKAAAIVLQSLKHRGFKGGQVIINYKPEGGINLKSITKVQTERTQVETNPLTSGSE